MQCNVTIVTIAKTHLCIGLIPVSPIPSYPDVADWRANEMAWTSCLYLSLSQFTSITTAGMVSCTVVMWKQFHMRGNTEKNLEQKHEREDRSLSISSRPEGMCKAVSAWRLNKCVSDGSLTLLQHKSIGWCQQWDQNCWGGLVIFPGMQGQSWRASVCAGFLVYFGLSHWLATHLVPKA